MAIKPNLPSVEGPARGEELAALLVRLSAGPDTGLSPGRGSIGGRLAPVSARGCISLAGADAAADRSGSVNLFSILRGRGLVQASRARTQFIQCREQVRATGRPAQRPAFAAMRRVARRTSGGAASASKQMGACRRLVLRGQITPRARMASATRTKPAIFAPRT